MKRISIKSKLNVTYAIILTILLLGMLLGAFYTSHSYTINEAGDELKDEVQDLQELLTKYPDLADRKDSSIFYDDSMIMGLYYEDGTKIAGIIPEGFPEDLPFEGDKLLHAEANDHSWYYYDLKLKSTAKGEIWIRGVHSCQLLDGLASSLIKDMLLLIPVWLLIMLIAGHLMTKHVFRPMTEMTRKAKELSDSKDLAERLPTLSSHDELAELSSTFNAMLDHLQQHLQSEKQFTSDAAHELRTPISIIISDCEYCLAEYDPEPELRKELLAIKDKAQYLSDLVSGLLLIARAENNRLPMEKEPVDLCMLAEMVSEELQTQADEKDITLATDCRVKEATINGDQNLLMQAVMNLLENSVKYGKVGGKTVTTIDSDGDEILLKIRDNGIGIPDQCLDKIWDRFYRVREDAQADGMGLGLFMVRWIVERHGGTITCTSTEGVGTEFQIRLQRN